MFFTAIGRLTTVFTLIKKGRECAVPKGTYNGDAFIRDKTKYIAACIIYPALRIGWFGIKQRQQQE